MISHMNLVDLILFRVTFIEQYICAMSEKFLYIGGGLAKPDHTHLRSTWSSFVIDYRICTKPELNFKRTYIE